MAVRLIRKLAAYALAAALGAAGALLYGEIHGVQALHGRVEAAWSNIVYRYGERASTVLAFASVVKAAGGSGTATLENAVTALAAIPCPEEPNDRNAFRHWEQAEINVSVALADFFRSEPGGGDLRRDGNYAMALSRLEGTESGINEAVGRYNQAVVGYDDGTAKGPPAWISAVLDPGAAQWEAFTAFPDYGPLDDKKQDND